MAEEVEDERRGRLAILSLNRPQALNALTLPMIERMSARLAAWAVDPSVAAVAVVGAGERAFCAGGDVRALYEAGRRGDRRFLADFYRAEYRLDYRIKTYPKPYVALMNGVAMGGGVGVSVNGALRVATEASLFAMPETSIGFFPDVGATWFLPRCPGRLGYYLGLSGARIGAADMLHAGIATHYVARERWPAMLDALAGGEAVEGVIERLAETPPAPAVLPAQRAAIDRVFALPTVEAMLEALGREGDGWAGETRAALARSSPLALKVTLAALEAGRGLDFGAALAMEYRLSQRFMAGTEFFEGVRAAVIDKDRRPRWSPAALSQVSDGMVENYFRPLDGDELVFN